MTPYVLAAGLAAVSAGLGFRVGSATIHHPPSPEMAANPIPVGPAREDSPGQPVGWVSLVDPAEGESLPQRVPILAATAANEAWLQQQPTAISAYVKAQWERRGYLIEENRRLVGLDLEDGRHVAVPVDELALDYVGRQPL